jgi:hypothetical protein
MEVFPRRYEVVCERGDMAPVFLNLDGGDRITSLLA